LIGRTVLAVERLAPAGPKYARLGEAVGRRIGSLDRRGKFLLAGLASDEAVRKQDHEELELVLHLGMTGVLTGREPQGSAAAHVRVRLELDGADPSTLYFVDPRRFGRLLVVTAGEYDTLPTLAALGPEPLGDGFTAAGFRSALARSGMPIKTYLLSQRPVAGVGNIYADEALWRARINPLTPAKLVTASQAADLHCAIRDVLSASIQMQGTTLSDYRTVGGEAGSFAAFLDVYGHAGDACRRCGAQLRRIVVGQRGTVYCPVCQPGDVATAAGASSGATV
jgi:formamidopyrimidine-DNA glycosylase